MEKSRKPKRLLLITSVVAIIASMAVAAGIAYSMRQPQLASLRSDNNELHVDVLSLQDKVSDLSKSLGAYHKIAAYQEEVAHSLRLELDKSIGDRLVMTEGIYAELPKTKVEAEAQGYSLLDTVTSEGKLIQAACFSHEGVRHYGQRNPKVTSGVEWHGAPFLLAYSSANGELMGIVLESTSPQSSPPWEYHPEGHPQMDFGHWSLHSWFVDPPENLSLTGHHEM